MNGSMFARPKTTPNGPEKCSIAVVGGGISGLAAAHRILEICPDAQLQLYEARERLGGVLHTERQAGFLIEHGADNFLTTPAWAGDLCQRLGMGQELIGTQSTNRRAFVVHDGKLHAIPSGFAVMAPSRVWPIVSTPILSLGGKLRMASEVFVPKRRESGDESIAAFVRRRLGTEVYERLVQPLIAGIFTGDPERLSVDATMPRFRQMELDHGSLIRGMWKQRKHQGPSSQQSSGARYSQFVAPRLGMSALVQAIVDRLTDAEVCLKTPVEQMRPRPCGGWSLDIGGTQHRTVDVDGVVLATPAHHSASLLQQYDPNLASEFASIEYGSCALVSLGFRREQIGHALDGFGCVVPAVEGRRILSVSFSSIKYAERAPGGDVLLRVFVGGARQSELVALDDESLKQLVLEELNKLLAIRGDPILFHVTRQIQAMPQYHLDHEAVVQRIIRRTEKLSNFALAGNALYGIGIPNCIHSGETAAESVLSQLSQQRRCETGAQLEKELL